MVIGDDLSEVLGGGRVRRAEDCCHRRLTRQVLLGLTDHPRYGGVVFGLLLCHRHHDLTNVGVALLQSPVVVAIQLEHDTLLRVAHSQRGVWCVANEILQPNALVDARYLHIKELSTGPLHHHLIGCLSSGGGLAHLLLGFEFALRNEVDGITGIVVLVHPIAVGEGLALHRQKEHLDGVDGELLEDAVVAQLLQLVRELTFCFGGDDAIERLLVQHQQERITVAVECGSSRLILQQTQLAKRVPIAQRGQHLHLLHVVVLQFALFVLRLTNQRCHLPHHLDRALNDDVERITTRVLVDHHLLVQHHDQFGMLTHIIQHVLVVGLELITEELDAAKAVLQDLSLVFRTHDHRFACYPDDLLEGLLRLITNHLLDREDYCRTFSLMRTRFCVSPTHKNESK